MAVDVRMPKLGLTMEQGTIAKWNFADGDAVKAGDVLYQAETDKLTNDVTAEADGILHIKYPQGAVVPAVEVVAVIAAPGEAVSFDGAPSPTAAPKSGTSPAAAKMAAELGVDLSAIRKDGRIMKEDVRIATDPSPPAPSAPSGAAFSRVPMSAMRKAISRNMSASWHLAPMVSYNLRADVSAMTELKNSLKAGGVKVSHTDILVKIAAHALMRCPPLNSTIEGDDMLLHDHANIGVAVALDNGLIVPVIREAENKSIGAISEERKTLVEKARHGRLAPEEFSGGTFTISNLGMFGIESFTPIVNQPESAILGVNAIVKTAVEVEGALVVRRLMNLSLTADHRAVDGAEGAKFLSLVRGLIENPWKLLV